LLARWQPLLDVRVQRFFVQTMKTKWGSCHHKARTIRFNTELAKKPAECLEYIVVHELVHLLEPTHNARFVALMDRLMPEWQFYRQMLNRLPARGGHWNYCAPPCALSAVERHSGCDAGVIGGPQP